MGAAIASVSDAIASVARGEYRNQLVVVRATVESGYVTGRVCFTRRISFFLGGGVRGVADDAPLVNRRVLK
jgi:hypothetical protein